MPNSQTPTDARRSAAAETLAGDAAAEPNTPSANRSTQRAKAASTRAGLLRAAAIVVERDGVAALTLDRVAEQAGVSKGGLLYHFSGKRELVVALLTSTLDRADERLDELAATHANESGAFAKAYLDYVSGGDHARDSTAAGVFAAAASDDDDLAPARERFAAWQRRLIDADGIDETTALLARIVGDGLWLIDLFGLASPDAAQRQAVVDRVVEQIDMSRAAEGSAR